MLLYLQHTISRVFVFRRENAKYVLLLLLYIGVQDRINWIVKKKSVYTTVALRVIIPPTVYVPNT